MAVPRIRVAVCVKKRLLFIGIDSAERLTGSLHFISVQWIPYDNEATVFVYYISGQSLKSSYFGHDSFTTFKTWFSVININQSCHRIWSNQFRILLVDQDLCPYMMQQIELEVLTLKWRCVNIRIDVDFCCVQQSERWLECYSGAQSSCCEMNILIINK